MARGQRARISTRRLRENYAQREMVDYERTGYYEVKWMQSLFSSRRSASSFINGVARFVPMRRDSKQAGRDPPCQTIRSVTLLASQGKRERHPSVD